MSPAKLSTVNGQQQGDAVGPRRIVNGNVALLFAVVFMLFGASSAYSQVTGAITSCNGI